MELEGLIPFGTYSMWVLVFEAPGFDPELRRYVPDSLPSGLAFPDNDTLSRVELGFGGK